MASAPASDPAGRARITAWQPAVAGVREVFHARFGHHAYPMHTHDAWAVLIVDAGAVRYGLGRQEHGATGSGVTLLPPHVPHDGRAATAAGFTKRVLYLAPELLADRYVGRAVDGPTLADPLLHRRLGRLHATLARPGDELESASRLAFVVERLSEHLERRPPAAVPPRDAGVARRLRDLLDASVREGCTLTDVAAQFGVTPTHLIRAFSHHYGLPPHRYLTGRRVEVARRLLLAGHPPAEVAGLAGFYDQPHLTRHFRRMLGTTPARYAAVAASW
jgi:AraC-like DNA-binding protein